MNALSPSPASMSSRAELREFIAEHLALARIQAELGITYAEIGDDVGLDYALRRHAAYMRAVIETFRDLQAGKQRKEAVHA
jgi:hypothetical protein